MPSSAEILENLRRISDEGSAYAVAWHVLLGGVAAALLSRRRPPPALAAWLVVALFASVSVFAWRFDNSFNGSVFAALAAICGLLAWLPSPSALESKRSWTHALGVLMLAFGWAYPHFAEPHTALSYLYSAPTGLIPCPTLSVALGFGLLDWLPGRRSWTGILAMAAVFYGLFGVLRLGVAIDLMLLVGALGLLAKQLLTSRRHAAPNIA
jgi:hypothetical protein